MKQRRLLELAAKAANPDTIMTPEEKQAALDEIQAALDKAEGSPWWVIVLKVLAYAIGLLLAGYGTSAAAQTLIHLSM